MLDESIVDALKQYTANMQNTVTLSVQTGDHSKRPELLEFLNDVAAVTDRIDVAESDNQNLRSPISFELLRDGEPVGIQFSGIPSGHEFNSLILAILRASGSALKLDQSVQSLVKNINDDIHFEVFVSLSCHNCPEVVQNLNQFAMLNDRIKVEMIDGGLFQDVLDERDIQGVPSVFANGQPFATGKVDTASLVEKLREKYAAAPVTVAEPLPLQDMFVIGGGPAGIGAAVYAARKGLKVTLVADTLGGQVKDTMGIENLIGTPSTTGPKLTNSMKAHLDDYDITVREFVRVESIDKGNIKTVHLSTGEAVKARSIVVASGAKWRELGVPGERENIGNGVAYCPHCDGPFFKGKDVAVIGGGNSGIEAALDLAGIVKSVTVFEFLPELKADKVLIDQAGARDNIKIIKNAATQEIRATNGKVTSIVYQDRETQNVNELELAGVFVQIGLVPNSSFLEDVVELTPYKEVKIDERCRTSEPGIYAAGDVTTVPYKQIVIAMGEGAKASLAAFEYLLTHKVDDSEIAAAA